MKNILNIPRWFLLGLYTVITIIPIVILSLTLSVYFICIFWTSRWYVQRLKINYLTKDILDSTAIIEKDNKEVISKDEYTPSDEGKYANISYLSVDFTDLIAKNSETVGWIKVNNTNVNYSIVQHSDNEYYLKHDFNNRYNIYGWVYGDFRDDFEYFGTNTIMYAHNMTDRSMFGSLVWCLKESWYTNEENMYIKMSTPKTNTIWKIFSIYTINPEVYYLKTYFENDEEHTIFLNTLKNRSIYDFQEDVSSDDKIITLSTCTDDGTKRIVIHAKMVKVQYR